MLDKCPGVSTILQPTIKLKNCPQCGEQVELVSTDLKATCPQCGFVIYNDVTSCVQWCEYAKECVGEEMYNKLKKEPPAKPADTVKKEIPRHG